MLYLYQKATPNNPSPGRTIPRQIRFLPTLISSVGLGLVATVIWPMLSYQISQTKFLKASSKLLSPINYQPLPSKTQIDYTKASNWFVNVPNTSFTPPVDIPQTKYKISIPSLKIKDAEISLVSEDLSASLIHYPQTALPGQAGSSVIFGHSTLPQFFDPKNYSSIFATLPTIEIGSSIFITYDGIKYTYKVTKTYEVKPDETWVLRQEYDKQNLKLVTCVPPGTKLRRLIVEADLLKI